ncbi:MAG: hemerythrin domain-containing protein [Novosphingobium sp.]|nr:hemerythrin domain-containing protein [Novosphingobium sp.]
MFNLSKLREEHTELGAIARQFSAICASDSPPPLSVLDGLRRELQSKLFAHLQTEDWVLYPRLLDSPDPAVVGTARRFSHEMGGLAASFLNYVEKWNTKAITDNWRGYCKDTTEITTVLIARISRENTQLYPLLERLDRAA